MSATVCLVASLFIAPSVSAWAAVINAASGSRADVGAAVDSAADGDTVVIPAGIFYWTNSLGISKALTIQGAGIGQTRLVDFISSGGQIFAFNTVAGKSYRLTGIEFVRGATGRGFNQGVVYWGGSSTSCRMDHCKFDRIDNENVVVQGPFGVADHCEVELMGQRRFIMFHHRQVFNQDYGDGSWITAADWGGPDAWYVEDCKIWRNVTSMDSIYGCFDGWMGGRIVIRHCSITNAPVGNHGTESSQRYRSGRSMEFYNNTLALTISGNGDTCINIRGGGLIAFSNTFLGTFNSTFKLTSYRQNGSFPPWGSADGTKAWDTADLSDGPGTPGGAGDGVFEAGVSASSGSDLLSDPRKAWASNQWAGYILRVITNYTASSGGIRKAVVAGAGWTANQWAGYEFTRKADNSKGKVASNTADTLTLANDFYAVNMTGGGAFVLSKSALIAGNTANTLAVYPTIEGVAYLFPAVTPYEIRRIATALDDPGLGVTLPVVGSPPNHQNLGQTFDPIYEWGNRLPKTYIGTFTGYGNIKPGQNYFMNTVKPGYAPFVYPHPLVSGVGMVPAPPRELKRISPTP